ncbi:MAG: hypothetical protein KF718_28575 [Polyangiaceae bacterium]|nr:hypothetical protein [Polyangiaceae bacterium]
MPALRLLPSAFGLVGLTLLVSCRPPPPPAPLPHKPLFDEPEPEPEAEPAPSKPETPPPPPTPTSPPPDAEAGFAFGLPRREAMNLCTKKFVWRRHGEHHACTKPVQDPGLPGSPVLSFCGDTLCAVGVAHTPTSRAWTAWSEPFEAMRARLIERHGEPTSVTDELAEDCKSERLVECLESKTTKRELIWKWDSHVIRLTMGLKTSGEGPAAIRFVSMRTGAAAESAE